MPTHKRHPRQTLDTEKKQATFFKTHEESQPAFFPAKVVGNTNTKWLKSKVKAQHLLQQLQQILAQSGATQGKALELANQLLSTEIYRIGVLQEALRRIYERIAHTKSAKELQLSASFFQCNAMEQQVQLLLEAAIKNTKLPDLEKITLREQPYEQPEKAWADFILELLCCLPEYPLITLDTYSNFTARPAVPIEEGDTTTRTPEEKEEENVSLFRRIMRRVRNRMPN